MRPAQNRCLRGVTLWPAMINITPIHTFSDNFVWLIHAPEDSRGAVVDPGDARPVLERLEREGITLAAILITHKHSDHTGGIRTLTARFPEIPVYGPAREVITGLTHTLAEGDAVALPGIDGPLRVMDVPGHTEGHIAYYYDHAGRRLLFCADTLFSVGCGRVFSGTFDQLHDSLMRIAALPGDTALYCAHEYTLDNIGFAKWVEPGNRALLTREEQAHAQLDSGGDTVPSTLDQERATNPFLRIGEPAVISAVEAHAGRVMTSSRDTFRTLRQWKDRDYD